MATVVLLPPSEGKAPGGAGAPWETAPTAFPGLAGDRATVRDAVRAVLAAGEGEAAALLGARGPHLARALDEWDALDEAGTLPAAERYTGVVWGALDPGGLSPAARRRLRSWVLVPSGLWGLAAAGDPLPAYRLSMGARVPPLGGLAAWWRPRVTPLVAARAGSGWIIDMLPAAHRAAIDPDALGPARLLRIDLMTGGAGGPRAMGHGGKAMKGALARALLEAGARDPASVARLDVPGLRLDARLRDGRGGPVTLVFAPGGA
ncbi:MAG: YaaA family protein [Thermoleophilia bacterium]